METEKDVTIYDIAQKLKLATSTISRALNNHPTINEKTKLIVHETAIDMGYVPNSLAAGLRGNKINTIGVLVSTVTQPFISSLISSIEITAHKSSYNVIIMQSNDSYETEVSMAKSLYISRVSGVICSMSMRTTNTEHFKQFTNNKIPLVFVDRVPKEYVAHKVIIDNFEAGYKATQHLIDQGCKRIAHLTAGSKYGNLYSERKSGYIKALRDNGLEIKEEFIIDLKKINYHEGIEACDALLNLKVIPDGLFAAGDTVALSAITSAHKKGLRIPEDFAIIGFNNDPMSEIIVPNISTISHPAEQMGRLSAEIILKSIKNPNSKDAKMSTYLQTEVIERASSNKNLIRSILR